MSAPELLARAAELGVEVYLPEPEGGRVRARPADRLTPELLAALRRHKAEIRSDLRRQCAMPGRPPVAVLLLKRCCRRSAAPWPVRWALP